MRVRYNSFCEHDGAHFSGVRARQAHAENALNVLEAPLIPLSARTAKRVAKMAALTCAEKQTLCRLKGTPEQEQKVVRHLEDLRPDREGSRATRR